MPKDAQVCAVGISHRYGQRENNKVLSCKQVPTIKKSYQHRARANEKNLFFRKGDYEKRSTEQKNRVNYDSNGNMVVDLNKGITNIEYNHLNLPTKVVKDDGKYMKYVYNARGIKLAQEVYNSSDVLQKRTDYIGEFIYEQKGTNPSELVIIQHPEGRIVPNDLTSGWDYQYHLKDPFGNIRLTFTTIPKTHTFTGTFETESAITEEAQFSNIAETRTIFPTADANSDGGNEVIALNGNKPIGAVLTFNVGKGDELDIKANGYYEGGSGYSTQSALNVIVGAIAGVYGGVNGGSEAQQATYDGFNDSYGSIGLIGTSDDNIPAAFINYMLIDEDGVVYQNGYNQITTAANWNHELIELNDITVDKSGIAYIWISNESASLNWVHFDDMEVIVNESKIVQTEDFYPFGLRFNSWTRSTTKQNKFLFHNGTEFIDDLDLNWYHFKYRMHNPALGRFFNIDPLAESYVYNSPYAFAENKLGRGIELEGAELLPFPWLSGAAALSRTPTMARPVSIPRVVPRATPRLTPRSGAKRLPPEVLKNFRRGNKTEAEQLSNRGLEKNTKPYDVVDNHTGETTRTIPDSFSKGGKQTVEIKDVKNQSLTRQLKAQRQISNENGVRPKLVIRKGANLTEPLKNGGFDIEFFNAPLIAPSDATRVAKPFNPQKVEQGQSQQQQNEFNDCVARGDCS